MKFVAATCCNDLSSRADVLKADCPNLFSTGLLQVVSNLMKLTNLLQLVDKQHQAGKVDNLRQVCGVFDCVYILPKV